MLAWLTTYLRYIEWCVLLISWVGIAYATHHYDGLIEDHSKLVTIQTQVREIHDVKIVHDRTNALPVGDSAKQLLKDWQR